MGGVEHCLLTGTISDSETEGGGRDKNPSVSVNSLNWFLWLIRLLLHLFHTSFQASVNTSVALTMGQAVFDSCSPPRSNRTFNSGFSPHLIFLFGKQFSTKTLGLLIRASICMIICRRSCWLMEEQVGGGTGQGEDVGVIVISSHCSLPVV